MEAAICKRVRNPYLRDVLRRYATYNGSDVRRAPATLNCIAWVEMGLGGYGVEGGIGALVQAIIKLCEQGGVQLHTNAHVDGIVAKQGQTVGVEVNGRFVAADAVICNADVEHLKSSLLPLASRPAPHPQAPSMSGWNMIVRVPAGQAQSRFPHTVLFPSEYIKEFEAIFDRGEIAQSPTIYVCNQQMSHARRGWPDAEALFVMVNAPSVDRSSNQIDFTALSDSVMSQLTEQGVVSAASQIVWTRDPSGLAARFPGSQGALYGAASNSIFSAFRRPANRSKVLRGLYLAGGSAHPGGGVPLCILSGLAASRALMVDTGLSEPEQSVLG
ncbi:MAG TPA: hypothetical protein DCQ06_13300 [Myxococcales bacterium]|nr:hypothetical protein [Myxococcales bacterium]